MEGIEGSVTYRPIIRVLESRDVEPVLAIQIACSEVAQWTAWDYGRVVDGEGEMIGWVAEGSARVVGVLIVRRVASDIEILNLAVQADVRRCGIGTCLLRCALDWGRANQAEKAFLEVRISNLPALRFYERHKFEATSRRPRYYQAPIEDALLLTASLTRR